LVLASEKEQAMIKSAEFASRRKKLLQQMHPNSLAILPAAKERQRSNDVFYPYRQHSDFYYMTGFQEPEAIAVFTPERKEGEYILFNRVRHRDHEIWDGPRAGQEGAVQDFLANEAFSIEEFPHVLPAMLADKDIIYYSLGIHPDIDKQLINLINTLRGKIRNGLQPPITFIDLGPMIHEMRLFKSSDELTDLKKAVDISVNAHTNVMKACRPGLYEYELEADFTYTCQKNGARFQAYPAIVGSGKNSCILHYIANNHCITDHDLVLIDAGAEYEYYAADITRTFPANGHFSGEQRAIYELVLNAQEAAILSIKPGAAWIDAQNIIIRIITQGLIDLGILKGNVDDLIETDAYAAFYMHKSGHWLGLDVHDVGKYKINQQWRTLAPNMVLTVEPGLYFSADIKNLDKRWHNIGVRIEDDILVTETGCQILSESLPKTVADIEAIMKK
jgi:Xaa-Pro aminopeptidase